MLRQAVKIIDLPPGNEDLLKQTADLLFRSFREMSPEAWPTQKAARQEVKESLNKDRISRVAVDKKGKVLGWIGSIRAHTNLWELHPLVVETQYRKMGIGAALVKDLEEQVKKHGGLTIYLGTDDESNMTSISGIDLYPDVLGKLIQIRNIKSHPYEFYQKLGYTITGTIPDAGGIGKPDIIMSKRVRS
jgi:aminoglycoside 6'-N-acetyltransferase I